MLCLQSGFHHVYSLSISLKMVSSLDNTYYVHTLLQMYPEICHLAMLR